MISWYNIKLLKNFECNVEDSRHRHAREIQYEKREIKICTYI
jgi:hypothetical protein